MRRGRQCEIEEYQNCGIPEYRIVDPDAQKVLILELTGKDYTEIGSFSGNEQLLSPQFRELSLTAAQIFESAHQQE